MAAKGKRPMRALTASDKIEAIQRVNDGESKASVARDIGVPESTLRGWCKNEDKLRYMSTRHSTPDTDKSSDAEQPPEKRTRYDLSPSHTNVTTATAETLSTSVEYLTTSPEKGLDLSSVSEQVSSTPAHSEPIELTKAKTDTRHEHTPPVPEPQRHAVDLKTKPDATSVSMSAISPLTGLNPLPGVQNTLGLSFSDIASNLSLIAQLNPSLNALTSTLAAANTSAKTLRSIRSPKPSHISHATANTSTASLPLNLSDKYKSSKHEYSERRSKSHYKDPSVAAPVDEALWYWLKTQQAMLDLTATAGRPAHHERRASPKPVVSTQPLASTTASLDLNKNTWFWQYYKQFGGAMPFPSDKTLGTTVPTSREKNENILYSHLTKGKSPEIVQGNGHTEIKTTPPTVSPPVPSPVALLSERDTFQDKSDAFTKNQSKARTVLDNLLFNNNNVTGWEGGDETCCNSENEFDGVSEALEHGGKFLSWLEACRDPSVTRMHVHTLRALLTNIRARAARKPVPPLAHDRVSRRK